MAASVVRNILLIAIAVAAPAVARTEPAACVEKDGPDACKQKCAAKSQESCAVLGIMYLRGDVGGKPDTAKAEPLLRRACDAKVALGCGGLGSLYGVQNNFKKARPLFEKACAMGDALSCESIGGLEMGADRATPPSDINAATRKADVWYRRACKLGSPTACGFSAAFIVDKITEGTPEEGLSLYVKACMGGMGMACRHAADLLAKDTPEWKQLAAKYNAPLMIPDLLRRACALGDANACARTEERK